MAQINIDLYETFNHIKNTSGRRTLIDLILSTEHIQENLKKNILPKDVTLTDKKEFGYDMGIFGKFNFKVGEIYLMDEAYDLHHNPKPPYYIINVLSNDELLVLSEKNDLRAAGPGLFLPYIDEIQTQMMILELMRGKKMFELNGRLMK